MTTPDYYIQSLREEILRHERLKDKLLDEVRTRVQRLDEVDAALERLFLAMLKAKEEVSNHMTTPDYSIQRDFEDAQSDLRPVTALDGAVHLEESRVGRTLTEAERHAVQARLVQEGIVPNAPMAGSAEAWEAIQRLTLDLDDALFQRGASTEGER